MKCMICDEVARVNHVCDECEASAIAMKHKITPSQYKANLTLDKIINEINELYVDIDNIKTISDHMYSSITDHIETLYELVDKLQITMNLQSHTHD